MRLPIHSLRRKSSTPNAASLPVPHPTGSPPPGFNDLTPAPIPGAGASAGPSMDPIGGNDKSLSSGTEPSAMATISEVPAYSPPRRSGSIVYTRDVPARGQAPVIKSLDMKALVVEDYHTIKHFMKHVDWKVVWRKVRARHMWKWYAILILAIVLTVLVTTQHDAVVHYCAPVTRVIRSWPAGWMIPIALLIIVSYPPLVGHEIIGILIGLVWGLGEGFAILAAGTFIGEILLWFSFKWCCTAAAAKFERKNKLYWSLTQLIREKTFMFVLILRFSAIPGHIVTAVSASAGANYWSYLAAAFLTLPKQFTIVYLGSAFGHKEKKHVIISTVTMIMTIVVTGVAAVYIYYQMRLVMKRHELEVELGLARGLPIHTGDVQMVETGTGGTGGTQTWADVASDPFASTNTHGSSKRSGGGLEVDVDGKPTIIMAENDDEKARGLALGQETVYLPDLPKEELKGLAARRPWLFTNPSYSSANSTNSTAPLRAWSVPHHMTESEMREFMADMDAGQATPVPASSTPSVRVTEEVPPAFGSVFDTTTAANTEVNAHSGSGWGSGSRSSPSTSPVDSIPPRDLLSTPVPDRRGTPGTSPVRNGSGNSPSYSSRTTNSLDLAHRGLAPTEGRQGGREVADEADRYAYNRGGRRPDYGRMRGESRAALLGRPSDEAAPSRGET